MQGPVGTHHRKFFRRSPTLRPARARRPRPTPRRAADGPRRRRPDVPGPDSRRGTGGADAVNSPTFRYPMPAADPRTGRGECVHQRRQTVGFAALPHDIAADPRLSPTDLRVLAALLYYARQDPRCYPSDAALAARVHRHPGTVRRCLKRLEDLGYIRREFVQATPANPTGCLISMTFLEPDWPRPTPDLPEHRCAPSPERRRTPTPKRQRTPPPCAD